MKAIKEGIKEGLRIVVIALVPVLLAGINTTSGVFDIDWNIVNATVVVAIIKGVDKWAHEEPKIKADGLLPF